MTQDEWNKLPPHIKNTLEREGLSFKNLKPVSNKGQPATNFGVMNSPEYSTPLEESLGGFTFVPQDPTNSTFRVYNSTENPRDAAITRAHEAEHALAGQGRGSGSALNPMWDEMVGLEGAHRNEIVRRLIEHAPYLVKNWGLPARHANEGYFSKNVLSRRDSRNFLYEQLATLSAIENSTEDKKRRLVEDPYVRKYILKTPAERETYEALTGLRQTRLDAKDLPPYTRQPGSTSTKEDPDNKGFMAKIKSMLGMYQGGLVNRK